MSTTLNRCLKRLILNQKQYVNIIRNSSVWTNDNIVKSPFPDIDIPNITIPDHIWTNLDKWADKTAVVCGVTGQKYSYQELYKYSRNLAVRLRTHFQIKDGDVVCVMLRNSPDYPLVTLGALQAGATVTTVNPIYTAHEVSRQLQLSNTKLIISSSENISVIKEALQLAQIEVPIIVADTSKGYDRIALLKELINGDFIDDGILKEVRVTADDISFLPYSSGTTGLPKGVELTHKNVVINCCQQDEEKIKHYLETTKNHQERSLGVLPFFHIYGLTVGVLHKLSVGAQIVTLPKFQGDTFLKALEKHKVNLFYVAPPIVLFLSSHPDVKPKHLDPVTMFMCAAAPVPLADVKNLIAKAERSIDFLQGYGLTETSPVATLMTRGSKNHSSVGFALPNTQMKIVNSQLEVLKPNEVGELLIKGPQVMKGYKNNPEATAEAIIEDGWFRTGDLASIDLDGSLRIHDRLKELIKVKGFQVPPAELEGVLKEHPDILDAAVIGVPHQRFGEVPKAFIVLKNQAVKDADGIKDFVAKRVAEYKRINDVMFLEELPKNPSGKILRRILKDQYS